MILMQGKGASNGIVKGRLKFIHKESISRMRKKNADLCGKSSVSYSIDIEKDRFSEAKELAVSQLNALTGEFSEIFSAQAMLIQDEGFIARIFNIIEEKKCNAELAIEEAGQQAALMFETMEDEYMRARASDIEDITRRLITNLEGKTGTTSSIGSDVSYVDGTSLTNSSFDELDEAVILVAEDILPSEIIKFDKSKLLGIVTSKGSVTSHTTIIARILGIPYVCLLGESLNEEYEGKLAYIDGETGQVIVGDDFEFVGGTASKSSDKEQIHALVCKYEQQIEKNKLKGTISDEFTYSMKGLEDVTRDGKHIDLFCNISSPDDVKSVINNDGQGIGLFRSEFLFIASDDYPTEEEQFSAYKEVALQMNGKKVIIRTVDLGDDKQADFIDFECSENVRGIQFCLKYPDIFRTQLKALYRASAFGNVAIMFPMITSVSEVKECLEICGEVKNELKLEGISYNPNMEVGIMIETLEAVNKAKELAELVDFFSVGTNDLTRTLKAGNDEDLGDWHTEVLRAVKVAADAAHGASIPIGICGEMAADASLVPTLISMGIDELSVAPSSVPSVREAIRKSVSGKIN